ncbi:lysozyme [Olleya marilimosa]|uniref:lysozyme n=1 Tax=Olleya marilimosa TaxID=272164 RepID=UPI0030EE38AA|tara:strand:- start:82392 stop:82853 length:462 start_codon:yes stop_codon:yes gene_type:complete
MKVSKKGLNLIKKHEGWRNHPYLDIVGVPTIGYGNTYYNDGRKVYLTDKPITLKEGEELLKIIVNKFEAGVNKLIKVQLNENQFDALVSFAYNLGLGALGRSTLLKKVNNNPNDESIKDEFKRWNRAGGKVVKGLKKRRNEEAYLYFTPILND